MVPTLRPAVPEDLDGIVAVFLACWRNNYARVMPSRLVESMTAERATTLWGRALHESALADGAPTVVVAADGGADLAAVDVQRAVRGVTRWALEDGKGIIHSLYVDPAIQGGGVGQLLLQAAEDRIAAAGAATATLWVFGGNAPSLAFYRRRGWAPDGAVRASVEFGEPEVRLGKALSKPWAGT